ncbi:MAG: DUF104 domain-containing protein [Chloroflexi bacterium]|nr:MAG: DUF104 domain-containing protein [Chloroflexota bacterium]
MTTQTIEAIYENGILRPLKPLNWLTEQSRVRLTIEIEDTLPHPLSQFAGILSDEEASELQQIIKDEFEQVDLNAW